MKKSIDHGVLNIFVILAYDVNEKRVNVVNKVCSKYLIWRQNSVFTGRIGWKQLNHLIEELKETINYYEDYVSVFIFPSNVKFEVLEVGIKRYDESNVIW